ncbi:hypothetical protein ES703_66071 [subsurface metagenome]
MSRTDTYTVVVGKIPTSLVATTPPPSSAVPGESISFIVQLKDTFGDPLAGKTVTMYVNGESASVASGSDGMARFGVTFLAPGTFTIYAEFAGDVTYEGCDANVEDR